MNTFYRHPSNFELSSRELKDARIAGTYFILHISLCPDVPERCEKEVVITLGWVVFQPEVQLIVSSGLHS